MTAVDTAASLTLDHSALRGEWANTNANGSVATITIRDDAEGRLWIEATGRLRDVEQTLLSAQERTREQTRVSALQVTRDGIVAWGRVEGHAYAFNFEDRAAGAFDAVWDLGFLEVRMQANVKLGVLVVVTLNHFRDDSGRSSYFDREFYHRVKP